MTTKLTLTIEESVIDSAKAYARDQGRSLSDIVENYLKILAAKSPMEGAISPKVLQLRGSIKLPANFDYKSELGNAIAEKYAK
jgi:hypothetical protein